MKHQRFVRLMLLCLAAAAPPSLARSEQQICQLEPQSLGDWHYRTKVGGRSERCYYVGPRMKPRKELYWAEAPTIPPMSIMEPKPEPELELRWKGTQ
jgi:hypothetical protein